MSRTVKPKEVKAKLLRKGDRLWFKFQHPNKGDYITNIWGYKDQKVMVQCDGKFSSREYNSEEMVRIHPRKKKVKKVS